MAEEVRYADDLEIEIANKLEKAFPQEKGVQDNATDIVMDVVDYFQTYYDEGKTEDEIRAKLIARLPDYGVTHMGVIERIIDLIKKEFGMDKWDWKNREIESLNEADDDIMSDDDLDAEEQRERDEMEARFKARRDKVAQQRADRDAKIARKNEFKAKADELVKAIGDDWSFEHVFDVLVPESGKADTVAGELVRAVNKLEYRWFNDGDRWFEDYGIYSCGSPALFLMNFEDAENEDIATPFWDIVRGSAEDNADDSDYDAFLNALKEKVIDLINQYPEYIGIENTTDSVSGYMSEREVENWINEEGLLPTYELDASIPPELDAHLEAGNIDERDVEYEVESWCENFGNYGATVDVSFGSVYVSDLDKRGYEELDGNLYDWLEDYAHELDDEYGIPGEEEEPEEEVGEEE